MFMTNTNYSFVCYSFRDGLGDGGLRNSGLGNSDLKDSSNRGSYLRGDLSSDGGSGSGRTCNKQKKLCLVVALV
ncbi:42051_t:CDS:2 [Gigaspora margarita]|uniref:42051_t:CDS:1 n=1 Tax=Gigaspora margarita TaxID=4874 RepID=A0ABN7UJG1_GIGMA|nr:42051_t:CDS:2 [Gigaspora margarita]